MKRAIMSLFPVLLMLVVFGLSIATEQSTVQKSMTDIKRKNTVKGTVKSIDLYNQTITISKRNQDFLVVVNDETKILMGKKSKTLSDIKVGQKTRVTYDEVDGNRPAKILSIRKSSSEN